MYIYIGKVEVAATEFLPPQPPTRPKSPSRPRPKPNTPDVHTCTHTHTRVRGRVRGQDQGLRRRVISCIFYDRSTRHTPSPRYRSNAGHNTNGGILFVFVLCYFKYFAPLLSTANDSGVFWEEGSQGADAALFGGSTFFSRRRVNECIWIPDDLSKTTEMLKL